VIGGLQGLRKFYQAPRVDPAQLVRNILYDLWIPSTRVKIVIADKTASDAKDRQKARAMIVTMQSAKQKKDTIQKIKRYLLHWGIEETSVEDYFPSQTLSKAKQLRRAAAEMKREGRIHGYRVINVQGTVVLQTCKEGEAYESMDESHIDLSRHLGAEQAERSSTQEANS
jgi:multimeric flavodoxin WrbA